MRIKTGMCEVYARARGCETAYALAELANSLHDQAIVGSPDSAPDGRRVYKLWDDGEITYEKGGCAYGRRGVNTLMGAMYPRPFERGCFACKHKNSYGCTVSFVICSEAHAVALRARAAELSPGSR